MACSGDQSVALACPAMGTRFEVLLRGADAVALRSAGEAAIEEVQRWHALLSAFDASSIVSRINREAAVRPVPIPPEVAALLRWCGAVSLATSGAFNPAVGHLMHQSGFRGEPPADRPCPEGAEVGSLGWRPRQRPQPVEARTSSARPGRGEGTDSAFTRSVYIDEHGRVGFAESGIALDFGAIGKGWALDRAAEILREAGAASAILHGGTSSIITIGNDGEAPWRVAMGEGGDVLELADEAVGLSMPTGRVVRDRSGVERGHIIDPRTGRSASAVAMAAVIGPSAAVCDAWSTALVVEPSLVNSPSWPDGYRAFVNLNNRGGDGAACSAQVCRSNASETRIEQGSVR